MTNECSAITAFRPGRRKEIDQQVQNLARARAHENLLGAHLMPGRELVAQRPARAVGVAMEVAERGANRGHRHRRRTDRILVGGELGRLADAQLALDFFDRLAGLVGMERGNRGQNQIVGFYQGACGRPRYAAGCLPSGYDPSTFKKRALRSSAASARLSPGSSRWPAQIDEEQVLPRARAQRTRFDFRDVDPVAGEHVERLVERADLVAHREQRGGLVGAGAAGRMVPDHQKARGVLRRVLDIARDHAEPVRRRRRLRGDRRRAGLGRRALGRRACWRRPPRARNAESSRPDSCGIGRATADGNR